jgi:hypothetical protein
MFVLVKINLLTKPRFAVGLQEQQQKEGLLFKHQPGNNFIACGFLSQFR